VSKPSSCAEAALDELCVHYGHCIPSERREELLAEAAEDAGSFIDAVLAAEEGRDVDLVSRQERDVLLNVVRDWLFDKGHGRGTKSGLPRYPPDAVAG
jgi:hypothetical protein